MNKNKIFFILLIVAIDVVCSGNSHDSDNSNLPRVCTVAALLKARRAGSAEATPIEYGELSKGEQGCTNNVAKYECTPPSTLRRSPENNDPVYGTGLFVLPVTVTLPVEQNPFENGSVPQGDTIEMSYNKYGPSLKPQAISKLPEVPTLNLDDPTVTRRLDSLATRIKKEVSQKPEDA